jgi:two-component system CheB/CheR fusion protein
MIGCGLRAKMSSENEQPAAETSSPDERAFDDLLEYLRRARGFDFSAYKRPSLKRRVQKRLGILSIAGFHDYVDYLEVHPDEFSILFNTILINVTAFFRDETAWDVLRTTVIPGLLQRHGGDESIRVWSAGCASGEEAYSIAILLVEALGREVFAERVKIYATDIDEEALSDARRATYEPKQVDAVPAELLHKYFRPDGDRVAFDSDLRRSVIFGRHDLLHDAPISRINLVVCRNTLMYFSSEAQARILSRFQYALVDDAILFLGKAEMLLARPDVFAPIDLRSRIFRKVNFESLPERFSSLTPGRHDEPRIVAMSTRADLYTTAFELAPIAQLVIDANGALAMYNDRARTLFGLAPSDVGRPFHELEMSYRPVELRSLLQDAQAQRRPIVIKDVRLATRSREPYSVDVQVTPLFDEKGLGLGASLSFSDVSRVLELQEQLTRSKQDLETTYEELQSTNEELETTNEELQSTVEELETTNEELQSTNEELETTNEELQSTNEELQSTNAELRDSGEALNHVNRFLESIMRGIRGAVIVVNKELHVIAWNHRSEDLWGLRADEVRNQNVFGLDIGLPIEQLRRPIRACLTGENELTELSLTAMNRRGKAIECKVTCTALRSKTDVQGVIILVDEIATVEETRH